MEDLIRFYFLRQSQWGSNTFSQFTPDYSGKWKNIVSVDDVRDAEYLVIFSFPTIHIRFPPEKTLYVTGEPDEFNFTKQFWASIPPESHKFPITERGMYADWKFWRGYTELRNMKEFPAKTKDLSWVTTKFGDGTEPPGLQVLSGHKLRAAFLKNFLKKFPNRMYLYGRDLNDYIKYQDFKYHGGELTDKWDGVEKYRYNIGIENSWQRGLFTTQYCDAVLAGAMPIYWGCPNLEDFFPKNSFIRLDIKKDDAPEEVIEIIKSDFREQNLDELYAARELILDKYSLFARLHEYLNEVHSKTRTVEVDKEEKEKELKR